jgi:hypothetical protein
MKFGERAQTGTIALEYERNRNRDLHPLHRNGGNDLRMLLLCVPTQRGDISAWMFTAVRAFLMMRARVRNRRNVGTGVDTNTQGNQCPQEQDTGQSPEFVP